MLTTMLLLAACAHTRVRNVGGCWVQETEGRLGDTAQVVAMCEPKAPKWSTDPVARSVEACLYQAQMNWYNDAIERFRTGSGRSAPFSWADVGERCAAEAHRAQQKVIDGLSAQLGAAEARADRLIEENKQLRDTIVACVEKQPNAIATAHADSTSGSDSGADSSQAQHATPRTRTKVTPAVADEIVDRVRGGVVTTKSASDEPLPRCVKE
jgi:hypothetical protein